jgi:hypothetical protein
MLQHDLINNQYKNKECDKKDCKNILSVFCCIAIIMILYTSFYLHLINEEIYNNTLNLY